MHIKKCLNLVVDVKIFQIWLCGDYYVLYAWNNCRSIYSNRIRFVIINVIKAKKNEIINILLLNSDNSIWFFKLLICFSLKRNLSYLLHNTQTSVNNNITCNEDAVAVTLRQQQWSVNNQSFSTTRLNDHDYVAFTASVSSLMPEHSEENSRWSIDTEERYEISHEDLSPNGIKSRRPQIECLHGIRFVSFLFILIYHTFTEGQMPSGE